MDSILAELVLSGTLYKKTDFVIYICQKCFTNLLAYIELYEQLKKRHVPAIEFKYSYDKWKYFMKPREDIKFMIQNNIIINERDFKVEEECIYFNPSSFNLVLDKHCYKYLDQLECIYSEYKYYLDNLLYLNINVSRFNE